MNEKDIKLLLEKIRTKKITVDQGIKKLRHLPFEDIGFARIDHHRVLRQGFPEVLFGQGKTPKQIFDIVKRMLPLKHNILITRTEEAVYRKIKNLDKRAKFYQDSGTIILLRDQIIRGNGTILIISAGTSDIPVAEEAMVTAHAMGNPVETSVQVDRQYTFLALTRSRSVLGYPSKLCEADDPPRALVPYQSFCKSHCIHPLKLGSYV